MFRSVGSTMLIYVLCAAQVAYGAGAPALGSTTPAAAPKAPVKTEPPAPPIAPQPPAPSATIGAQGPLAKRQVVDLADARAVIEFAELRFLEDYFSPEVTAAKLELFEFDIAKVIDANVLIQFIEQKSEFSNWYHRNKLGLLKEFLAKYPRTDLQRFTASIYLKYRLQAGVQDPNLFMEWLARLTSNPWIRDISSGTAILIVGVLGFALRTAHGAMVAGPMASFLTNFFEPLLRPIREKITITGARLWEKGGLWLNGKLFNENEKSAVKQETGDARSKLSALQKMVDRLGYEMSPEQFHENLNRIHNTWNQVNQIWLKTQPTAYQNGRAIVTDALIFRHETLSRAVLVSVHAAETHLQGAEQMVDRLSQRSLSPTETEAAGRQLEKLVENQLIAAERGPDDKVLVDKQIQVLTERLDNLRFTPGKNDFKHQPGIMLGLYELHLSFDKRA